MTDEERNLMVTVAQALLDVMRDMAPEAEGRNCPLGDRIAAIKNAVAAFAPRPKPFPGW